MVGREVDVSKVVRVALSVVDSRSVVATSTSVVLKASAAAVSRLDEITSDAQRHSSRLINTRNQRGTRSTKTSISTNNTKSH